MKNARTSRVALALAAGLVLAGCTSTVPMTTPSTSASPSASATESAAAEIAIMDPWVKATDSDMTGAFGILVNNTDTDIKVVAVSSTVTERAELHETVSRDGTMVMQEMADGFIIPAGGRYVLEPGGNHLMLMDLTAPIEAGTDVELTLEFEDGSTFSWLAPARTFAGAQEEYRQREGMPEQSPSEG